MDSSLPSATSTPLSAPKSPEQIHKLNVVILVAAVLSVVGAVWMIMGFVLNKSLRTFRHQLILGLAISDLCMAINFLSSSAVNLSGQDIGSPDLKSFCSFNGFMIQTFVDQTDYWVLSIATCTFIMVNDRKSVSQWIQTYRVVVFALPWILSLLWATLGVVIVGYDNIGAWCWFTSDKVRLLVNFLPRWIIILVMLALYIRLYFIINRAHTNFVSLPEDGDYEMTSRSRNKSSTTERMRSVMSPKTSQVQDPENGNQPQRSQPKRSKTSAPDLKRMMMYPLVYMLIWALPTSIRIYQSVTGVSAPFNVAAADGACIVIQGFLDAVVYGLNEKTLAGWKEVFTRNKSC